MINIFPFLSLPRELQLLVLYNLPPEDQVRFCKTCRAFRNLCKTITYIPIKYHSKFTNNTLQFYTNLIELNLGDNNYKITDAGIQPLLNLKTLYLEGNNNITDAGIQPLLNLTELNLSYNKNITDVGIQPLLNLKTLHLNNNKNITDVGIQPLLNLKTLYLGSNTNITNTVKRKIRFVYMV
jgi:Leucine-rich repeat (LRR) protein